jgi:hypothetical protein
MEAFFARHAPALRGIEMVIVRAGKADASLRVGVLAFGALLDWRKFRLAAFAAFKFRARRAFLPAGSFLGLVRNTYALFFAVVVGLRFLMKAEFARDTLAPFDIKVIIVRAGKALTSARISVLPGRASSAFLFRHRRELFEQRGLRQDHVGIS